MTLSAGGKGGEADAAVATAAAIGKAKNTDKKKSRGRKDNTGQELTPDYQGLQDDFPALKKAYAKFLKVMDEFGDFVKDRAEARNVNSGVVKRWLKASVDGKFEERRRKAEQESDLFGMGNPETAAEAEGATKQ